MSFIDGCCVRAAMGGYSHVHTGLIVNESAREQNGAIVVIDSDQVIARQFYPVVLIGDFHFIMGIVLQGVKRILKVAKSVGGIPRHKFG